MQEEQLHRLLRCPMLLTLYCETSRLLQMQQDRHRFHFSSQILDKYDLLQAYFEGICWKLYQLSGDETALVRSLFVHHFLLPLLASQMGERFQISHAEVKAGIYRLCSWVREHPDGFFRFFYERDLEQPWQILSGDTGFPDLVRRTLMEHPTIFVEDSWREEEPRWRFIHQEYRDYCRYKDAALRLQRLLEASGEPSSSWEPVQASAVAAARELLQLHPNLPWYRWLGPEGRGVPSGFFAAFPSSAKAAALLEKVIGLGLGQMEALGRGPGNLSKEAQEDMCCLIRCMALQRLLLGESNFQERYLEAQYLSGKQAPDGAQADSERLRQDAKQLADWLKDDGVEVDLDLQLPTKRQLAGQGARARILISCKNRMEAYQALGSVLNRCRPQSGSLRDHIAMPPEDFYLTLQVVCALEGERWIEVEIRPVKGLRQDDRDGTESPLQSQYCGS
ncbi:MAG TPA: hypothetical protein H9736_02760 [Candidatus Anaerotruncus excrementipullorum]|uniref:Uncharacterized protein n=1 Tax=Candidatus Anaerotruncus excrementipullorum TaxID=2838465 RepID=A0A9D1WQ98_9FIRM|nr:hypothetical protein [Candidatus Anaerotruncus excrementipullorum]